LAMREAIQGNTSMDRTEMGSNGKMSALPVVAQLYRVIRKRPAGGHAMPLRF